MLETPIAMCSFLMITFVLAEAPYCSAHRLV
jgi:hypothetical protein